MADLHEIAMSFRRRNLGDSLTKRAKLPTRANSCKSIRIIGRSGQLFPRRTLVAALRSGVEGYSADDWSGSGNWADEEDESTAPGFPDVSLLTTGEIVRHSFPGSRFTGDHRA